MFLWCISDSPGRSNINGWLVLWEGKAFFLKYPMMCVCVYQGEGDRSMCVWGGGAERKLKQKAHVYTCIWNLMLSLNCVFEPSKAYLACIYFSRIKFSILHKIYMFLVNSFSLKACRSIQFLRCVIEKLFSSVLVLQLSNISVHKWYYHSHCY